jgi:hypothetical protein
MPPSRKWTKEDDDQLLALLAQGKTYLAMGKKIHRSEAAIVQRVGILKRREK